MVEPTVGRAMEQAALMTFMSQLQEAGQIVEEPEVERESQWSWVTMSTLRTEVEPNVPVTGTETGISKASVELKRQRTKVEPEG